MSYIVRRSKRKNISLLCAFYFEKLMIRTAFFACDKVDTGSLCLKVVLTKQYQNIHNTAEWEFDTALITYYCIKYDGFYKEDRCF